MANAVVHYQVVADCGPAMRSVGALQGAMADLSGTRVNASISVAGVGQAMNDFDRLAGAQQSLASPIAMSIAPPAGISEASAAIQGLRGDVQDYASAVSSVPSLDIGVSGAGSVRPMIDDFGALSNVVTAAANSVSGLDGFAGRATRSLADLDRQAQTAAASTGHAAAIATDYGTQLGNATANVGALTDAHLAGAGAMERQTSALAVMERQVSRVGSAAGAARADIASLADEFGGMDTSAFSQGAAWELGAGGRGGAGGGPPRPPRGPGGGGRGRGPGGGGDDEGGLFGKAAKFVGEHGRSMAMTGGMYGAVLGVVGAAEPIVGAAVAMEAFKRVVKDVPALAAASSQAMAQFDDGVRVAAQGIDNEGVPAFMRMGQAMLPFGEEVGRIGTQQMPNLLNAANQLIPDATSGLRSLEPGFGPAVQGTGDVVDSALKGILTPQMAQDMSDVGQMLQRPDVNRGVSEGLGDFLHIAAKTAEVAGPVFGRFMDQEAGVRAPFSDSPIPSPTSIPKGMPASPGEIGPWFQKSLYDATGLDMFNPATAGAPGGQVSDDIQMFGDNSFGRAMAGIDQWAAGVTGIPFGHLDESPIPDAGPGAPPAGPSAPPGVPESIANTKGTRLPVPSIDKGFFKDHPGGGTFKDKAGNTITGQMGADGSMQFQNQYASGDAGTYSYDAASGTSSIASHSLTDKFGSFSDATITRAGSGEQYGRAQDYNALTGQVTSAGPTESKPGQANGAEFGAPSLAVAQNMLANLPGGAGGGGGSNGGGGGGLEKYPPDVPRSIFNEEPPEIATNYDAFGKAHSHITNDFAQANVNVDHGHVSFATPFDAQVSNFSAAQLGQAVSNIGAPLGTPSNQGMSIMGHPANQSIMGPAQMQQQTAAINNQSNALTNLAAQSHTAAQAQTNLSAAIGNVTADAGKGQVAQTGLASAQNANANASQANANASQANASALDGLTGSMGSAASGVSGQMSSALSGMAPQGITADLGMSGPLGIGGLTGLSGIASAIGLGPGSVAATAAAAAPGIASGIGAATGAGIGAAGTAASGTTAGDIGAGIGASVGAGAGSPASTGAAAQGGADAGAAGAAGTGSSSGSDSHSPSRKSYQVGLWIGEGLVVGMKASESSVASAGASVGRAGVDGANNSMSLIAGAGVTAAIDSVASAQTAYNTALAGGFGASLIAASNGVTPIAQDYGLMIGESWAQNVATGAQNVFKSNDFTALTTPQFGSKLAQAQLGLENLLPPAGQGAEYYQTTSGSAGMVQMAPVIKPTINVQIGNQTIKDVAYQVVDNRLGDLAVSIANQRG